MANIKVAALSRELVLTAVLVGAATLAPLLHSQLVTGTIVNAALFAAVMLAGFRAATAVAVVPSLVALVVGTLPLVMAPMVPYIMAANIALAGIFSVLGKTNYWLAAMVASGVKFVLLAGSASIVLGAITQGKVSLALVSAMGWPQLITAVLGALVVYVAVERKASKRM
jgi:hypothetical protein